MSIRILVRLYIQISDLRGSCMGMENENRNGGYENGGKQDWEWGYWCCLDHTGMRMNTNISCLVYTGMRIGILF